MYSIDTCTPEEVGIPSSSVIAMIEELNSYQVPLHSLLLARKGKLCFEAYYKPFKKDQLHRMFSIGKSFTSLAIGLLEEEGKLSLDDCIVTYFPEYVPQNPHPWLTSMTIRDMLKMQTCHSTTTYKKNPDKEWVESFFTTPPTHPSGCTFIYDTSASHTLCALVEKLTKQNILDYLKDKVLNEIGFSSQSYFMKNQFGTSMGGSGLMATPMDLLQLGLLLINNGTSKNGKQLLPPNYLKEALSFQCSTIPAASPEESYGYGYQFWRTNHNGFVAYGMGGQLMICLPDYDLVCVTTADTQEFKGGNQMIYNALYQHILPSLCSVPLKEDNTAYHVLLEKINTLTLPFLNGRYENINGESLAKKHWKITAEKKPFDMFYFTFSNDKKEGNLHLFIQGDWHTIPFGLGSVVEGIFPIYNERIATSGAWISDTTFYVKCQLIGESVGSVHLQFTLKENEVCVFMKKVEETMYGEYQGFLMGEPLTNF